MLKTILKIVLSIAILYWLIIQGKLDFNLVLKSFQQPQYFILASFLISLQLIMGALRLGFLLKIKSQQFNKSSLISVQWIGQMFSTVLPGAFTSDLIKIGYIKKIDNQLSHSFIVFAIFIDRIIGLNSLLFIAGMTSLVFFRQLSVLHPMMINIIIINIILFLASLIGMALIFVNVKYQSYLLKLIPFKKLKSVAEEIWKLRTYSKSFLWAYIASILGHILSILAFWTVNISFFEHNIEFKYLATLIPLGQLAVVIPISPGGIGVGHAAFSALFQFIHHSNGASLYNVYWIMVLIVSLFGIFPFVLKKHKL